MAKHHLILLGLAVSMGMAACGSNNNSTDNNSSMSSDSSTVNTQATDSLNNTTPAAGMADSTLRKDSNSGGSDSAGRGKKH